MEKTTQKIEAQMEWQPIETAPRGVLTVSMRDVDREPSVWKAQRKAIGVSRHLRHKQHWFEIWVAEDGLICQPTHWLAPQTSR